MAEEKRCWLYTRIDAPEDTHGALKAQEKELLDYAAQQGFEVAGTASDLGPGTTLKRAGIGRMIDAAKEEQFQVLIVRSLDRLSRSAGDAIGLLAYLYDNGVETHTLRDGFVDVHKECNSFYKMLGEISKELLKTEQLKEQKLGNRQNLEME